MLPITATQTGQGPVRSAPLRAAPLRAAFANATLARTKLDWAIIAALLAMGALNLYVMADQFGATKAYAATHEAGTPTRACGASLA
ncbi:hypothetical protein [Novosphingobium sp. Leaf2]|uniref:hypothetical protein n=1 Tax=Novosphingobium sp. Leaf2 TaxID=1735670 RepID=UPI0006F8D7BF|nr:hypothetical protein [Novosphingobium sp. Leaf2]KQM22253.1 hypothetical protein ASE49_02905 [Novosphingobium sp. Leaf2]